MSKLPSIRPFDRAFDPAGIQFTGKSPCSGFSFLQHALLEPVHGLDHCNVFDPRAVDVPWPTSFPAVAQCKYWKDAEAAATNIMQEIEGATPLNQGSLPEEMRNHSSRVKKRNELLETAVTAPINMFPAANRQCVRALAKANVFIFMHDDVIESTSIEGMTIIDSALADFTESRTNSPSKIWKNEVFADFATEVIQEDPIAGPNLLKGILNWVQHTRDHLPGEMKFETFVSYIDYRIKDFAVDFCDAAMMMACKIYLSPLQMEPLASLHKLYIMHFSLTNDLYSYDKEALAMKENGSALLNGIKVLQDILGTSVQGTKIILRAFLWDLEARISTEYECLVSSGKLTTDQARFARAMLETCAGNMFYSATASRYCVAACGA